MNKLFQINKRFILVFIFSLTIVGLIYLLSNFLFIDKTEFDNSNLDKTQNKLYKIIKVIDGDTVVVMIGGKNETIRLIGINTPEIVDPRRPVECFGREASKKVKEALINKRIRLEGDDAVSDKDEYGRLLRYIFLEDGTNFNKIMIKDGYAYEYTYNVPYKYQDEFKQVETDAREAKKGLWADGVCKK
ncbi:MAG: thermonuclease family protein [Candidatus Pacebacteria bacterium]|nr:thermonuclease family protein [Candidatus Paceibacterota bacterium]